MSRPLRMPVEPVSSGMEHTGSRASGLVADAVARVLAWAGDGLEALVLSGSHAADDAVWARVAGEPVSLSDLDLYAVMRTPAACRAAETRFARARGSGEARVPGLAAPLEVAFLTAAGLAAQPARPGTIALARHGRVIAGDASVLTRLPRWRAEDVSAEETTLLLENRAFELLLARHDRPGPDAIGRLRMRHAVLKVALDVAGAAALAAGEWPDGAGARVAWARARGVRASASWPLTLDDRRALDRAWSAALAWRAGAVDASEPEATLAEWRAVATAWAAAWLERAPVGADADPWRAAVALAGRSRWRRRVRDAVTFRSRTGAGPALITRLGAARAGTVQHRVNASAGVLVLAAARSGDALQGEPARALSTLGVVDGPSQRCWSDASRTVVRAWDRWLLDGQRTAEAP